MRAWTACLAALLTSMALAGCGGDGDSSTGSGSEDAGAMDQMGGMDAAALDEPDATPANEMDGGVAQGDFTVLDTAPPGSDGVSGQAWLGQDAGGTTVTIRLRGLEPETDYVAHLHAQPCSEENGGPHFAFDPEGEEVPPNEVHLGFTSGPDGTGGATVTNDRRVGTGAPAVVTHPADAMDNRLACADFS